MTSLTMWSFSFLFFVFEKEIRSIAIVVLPRVVVISKMASWSDITSSSHQLFFPGGRKEEGEGLAPSPLVTVSRNHIQYSAHISLPKTWSHAHHELLESLENQ